jgi:hypothetical protein
MVFLATTFIVTSEYVPSLPRLLHVPARLEWFDGSSRTLSDKTTPSFLYRGEVNVVW